jgi:alkylated DNA repair dioxygenase AlkB
VAPTDPEPQTPVWLDPVPSVERVELAGDSWVDVVRGLVPSGDEVHAELAAAVTWTQGRVFRYERWVEEPRLSGSHRGTERHAALLEAQRWLAQRYRVGFDSYALAQYRDGRDSVAWHRDREMRWLESTVIGVLSLGQQRPFLMRPLTATRSDGYVGESGDPDWRDVIDLRPASGDLLVMGGRAQAAWLHAVPKVAQGCRSRISVQWRWTSRTGRRDPNPPYSAPRHFSRRGPGGR